MTSAAAKRNKTTHDDSIFLDHSLYPEHTCAVAQISSTVKQFYANNEPFRINHGSTNSTRQKRLQAASSSSSSSSSRSSEPKTVDISGLSRVLKVDTASQTALVEPNVPMDRLVEATLPHGLVPPVVMEFPGITVGGGYAGTGGESSSFRHGYFNNTVNWVEIVLGNGEIVRASRSENSDLFYHASGAVGSLGVTTLLELQLIPAKKFAKTTYTRVGSINQSVKKMKDLVSLESPEFDYLDGILFSAQLGAIVTAVLTDEIDPERDHVQRFSRPWDPWYYLHVRERVASLRPNQNATFTEYIPLAEYLFRYDRGGFWVGASAFAYFKTLVPFNRFTRWFLDDFMHTRMLYKALHAAGQPKNYIVQDLALPFDTVEQFINFTVQDWGVWPLWLCPLRHLPRQMTFHPHVRKQNHDVSEKASLDEVQQLNATQFPYMLNVGLWGYSQQPLTSSLAFLNANHALEAKVDALDGMKWLYAQTFYSEEDFWKIYGPKAEYDRLRQKWHAESLPSVWDKVVMSKTGLEKADLSWRRWLVQEIWPLQGLYGVWTAMCSGEWRIAQSSTWKYL